MSSEIAHATTADRGHLAEKGFKSWAFTLDHKRIGVMCLLTTLLFFLTGGVFGMLLRMKLLYPGQALFSDHVYNVFFTLHGAMMIFLFIIPGIPAALGNFFIPLLIGARDVVFPRLNLMSYWIFVTGILVVLGSLVSPMDTGWTFYTPYSARTGASITVLSFGLFLVGFASILTGLNFLVTIHQLRAPGMTWRRLPPFIWAMPVTPVPHVVAGGETGKGQIAGCMMTTAEYTYKAGERSRSLIASVLLLSRPGILALVALAGFSGMVMAAGGMPDYRISVLTLFSLLLSAAGSAMVNGVLDYPLDLKMARLQARVEAMTDLGRNRAMLFAGGFIIASMVLAFQYLNTLTVFLLLSAVLTYTLPYTLWLKRRSPFGAVPGGIPGALPVLVGYAAVAGAIRPQALLLFLFVFLWQPPHFWIFALKHKKEYLNAGLPVLPAVMGAVYTKAFILLYAIALLPASLALGFFGGFSAWFPVVAGVSGVLFIAACYLYVIKRPFFGLAFRISIFYLFFLFLAVITDICLVRVPVAAG